MVVNFFINNSDKRKLSKNLYGQTSKNCFLKNNCSVLSPVLEVTNFPSVWKYNYMFIEEMGRFFFINNITAKNNNIVEISGKVDVLSTYQEEIKGISTLIERQENTFSPYIQDTELLTRVERQISYKKIGSVGNATDSNIILTVTGGIE